MNAQAAPGKAAQQVAAQSPVLFKLLIFAICLGLAPIATYFFSREYLWEGNSTYGAITAVFAANVVLVIYIISAVQEDGREQRTADALKAGAESRKDQ